MAVPLKGAPEGYADIPLFSFPWTGTALEPILQDLHPRIVSYYNFYHYTQGKPLLKDSYQVKFTVGSYGEQDGQLNYPYGIAINPLGHVFVSNQSRVEVFTSDGTFTRSFVPVPDPDTAVKTMSELGPLAFDCQGNLIVGDVRRNTVFTVDPISGEFIRNIGDFTTPNGIAIDLEGNILITDDSNHIWWFTPTGEKIKAIPKGRFPVGIAVGPRGEIRVGQAATARVSCFDPTTNQKISSKKISQWEEGDQKVGFDQPWGINIGGEGKVVVLDFGSASVHIFSPEGKWLMRLPQPEGQGLSCPKMACIDKEGNLWVVDSGCHRVVVYA